MRKNIITLSLENIISFSRNITSHFTGKEKNIITLVLIIIMLSFANIINASSLNYQTETNISFTFNPTLSVNISSSDLVIPNLTPGTMDTSNEIAVTVSTNNVYGYNLYATVGDSIQNNTNLTRYGGDDVFNSISTSAGLSSLDADNTWGYTYSLDSGVTWSNYNGLPLYSATGARLKRTNEPSEDTVNFKIAAKSSATQPSGDYSNIINFTAVTKLAPLSLAESYEAYYARTGKAKLDGYYVMQDMNEKICDNAEIMESKLQVIDSRDRKVYWIAKLKDEHCWMTQNLDLDLSHDESLTSNDTDLNDIVGTAYQDGYTMYDGVIYWTPAASANIIEFTTDSGSVAGWNSSKTSPQFASKTNYVGSGHASLGNHYNWTATIASNDSSSLSSNTLNNVLGNPQNSICPKGWRLPTVSSQPETLIDSTNEFARLNYLYNDNRTDTVTGIVSSPLWFLMAGLINFTSNGYFSGIGSVADYWSSTVASKDTVYLLSFSSNSTKTSIGPTFEYNRGSGFSVRCLAR